MNPQLNSGVSFSWLALQCLPFPAALVIISCTIVKSIHEWSLKSIWTRQRSALFPPPEPVPSVLRLCFIARDVQGYVQRPIPWWVVFQLMRCSLFRRQKRGNLTAWLFESGSNGNPGRSQGRKMKTRGLWNIGCLGTLHLSYAFCLRWQKAGGRLPSSWTAAQSMAKKSHLRLLGCHWREPQANRASNGLNTQRLFERIRADGRPRQEFVTTNAAIYICLA